MKEILGPTVDATTGEPTTVVLTPTAALSEFIRSRTGKRVFSVYMAKNTPTSSRSVILPKRLGGSAMEAT